MDALEGDANNEIWSLKTKQISLLQFSNSVYNLIALICICKTVTWFVSMIYSLPLLQMVSLILTIS